ncbi:SusC/RagA family TonB-linked outer membrane protein [Paraflavitalea pollutisoli]|uniref:SusC/RagA family TonB-linked outer membrane protein n=1 Tax=Paraflavitalea pollutisoli TaxID=3034143 RepID=UPI0023EDE68D|nr:SusC/RagA family TonB-linked outer membrane protein [Paraflavitalea sp. H1-2-19X]
MLRSAYGQRKNCPNADTIAKLQRFYKLLFLIVWLIPMVAFNPPGESQVVNLNFKDAPLSKVLTEIRKQTGYTFTYSETDLAKAKPITINVANAKIFDALGVILQGQPLTYTVIERVIIIKEKIEKKIQIQQNLELVYQLQIDVRGRVINERGDPVAGVSIQVKGNNKLGTSTDGDGEFVIKRVEATSVLILTGTNIETSEFAIKGQTSIIVTVKGKTSKLDEVQIIAYGKSSQRMSLGPIVTIKAEDIEKQPINNPLLSLAGRVPGLVVAQENGIAGGGVTIRIQGRNNLDNSVVGSDPFIVVDGIPYSSQNLSTFSGGGDVPILGTSSNDGERSLSNYGSPLAYINPADIESITVLRDADATAIYGSRAANGAILITTKKGKPGSLKIDVNLQQGVGHVPQKIKLLSSAQYMEMRREAKRNDGRPILSSDYDLRGVWDTTRYTDWQKELIGGNANFTRGTVSVSGGSEYTQFLVSSTYGRESTVFPGSFANSLGSLHLNVSATSKDQRFKLQMGASYMYNLNKLPGVDFTSYALNLPPVAPALFNGDGSLNWAPNPTNGNSTWYNPLSKLYNVFETKVDNLISNASVSYRIIDGLELKSTFGFTSMASDQFSASYEETEKPEKREGRERSSKFNYNNTRSWIVEPQLLWQFKIGFHSLNVLAGTTFQNQVNDGRGFWVTGFSSDALLKNMTSGMVIRPWGVDASEYKYNAVFGRVAYSYRGKYLMNLSARRDGSSRFGSESQFNNFGSVAIGWVVSEENFFRRLFSIVSFAKIRGSYGTTGNDQIGNYRFMNLYQPSYRDISYQGTSGVYAPTGLPNPYLEWEETRKMQAGVDIGLFNDKCLLSINYYNNRSSNSLTSVNMPIMTGFGSYLQNLPAVIQNDGWEFLLTSSGVNLGNIKYNASFNLTIPRNKLVKFPGLDLSPLSNTMLIGAPLGTTKTYSYYGLNREKGIYQFNSTHGQPTSQPSLDDRTILYNTSARWYGGFQNSFTFKSLTLDFLWQFSNRKANDIIRFTTVAGLVAFNDPYVVYGNQPVAVLNRWQSPEMPGIYQKYASSSTGMPTILGDLAYKNLSFLRLKNISLSYTVPQKLLRRLKIKQLRIFSNGQNILTFSRYNGLDPETLSLGGLPPLRVITVGAQINL